MVENCHKNHDSWGPKALNDKLCCQSWGARIAEWIERRAHDQRVKGWRFGVPDSSGNYSILIKKHPENSHVLFFS